MAEKRTRRSFTREFKPQAVKRLLEGGRWLPEVATELGLSTGQLSTWRGEQLAAGSAEALAQRKVRARRKHARWGPRERALYHRHRGRIEGVHGEAKTRHGLARAIRRGSPTCRSRPSSPPPSSTSSGWRTPFCRPCSQRLRQAWSPSGSKPRPDRHPARAARRDHTMTAKPGSSTGPTL